MSALKVRTYLESQAKALGYKISPEAFSHDQLPTNGGKLCFVEVGKVSPIKRDQASIDFEAAATVRLFVSKSGNQKDVQGRAIEEAESFAMTALKNVSTATFQKLNLSGYDVEPFSQQNADVPVGIVEFEAGFVLGF